MRKFLYSIVSTLVVFLSSCSGSGSFLPNITGTCFDLLVVGSDSVWKSSAGTVLDSALGGPMPALPQDEPFFKVIHIQIKDFDATVKTARNILFYEVNPYRYTKGTLRFVNDKWAENQAVAYITAPDTTTLMQTVRNCSRKIQRYFSVAEEKRARNFFSTYQNSDFGKHIYNKFGVGVIVPIDLKRMRDTSNFVWMSSNSLTLNQNMCVFTSPYKDKSDFSPEHLVAVQDSFTKHFIQGPSDNSFMEYEPRVELDSEVLPNDYSDYCVEVRGCWHCPKDFMGGPFVSRNYLSADHKSIITAMVFLYGPGQDKRNRLRMLEAAAGSLMVKVPQDSTATKK